MLKPRLHIYSINFIFLVSGFLLFSSAVPLKDGVKEDILKYTNKFRKSNGLPALEIRDDLNTIARKHSEDMAKGRISFGHGGFNQREVQVKKIISSFHSMAENIAYGANSGKEVFEIWKRSSGHRKNMLGNYKYIGIGTGSNKRGVIYYTEIFVR
jgi:uncharacterized protein YkwD